MITLAATKRDASNTTALRTEDKIAAVYYGMGKDAVSIGVNMKEFTKVLKTAGETTAVTLDVDGEKVTTMIHDMQHHPITGTVTHVDFLVIDMKKEIEVAIPIEFTGLAEAEKGNLGTLVKMIHEVMVRALPNDLPNMFTVDVTTLATLDAQIHVSDIVLPKGVIMITDGEEVVAGMAAFVEEKEEVPTAIDFDAIKVEEKGKKEEEGEAAAE